MPDENRPEATPDAEPAPGTPPEAPAADLAGLTKERDEARDQLLRVRAEFANYQKRTRQQAESDRIYAVGDLSRDLLDVLDNMQRATDAIRSSAQEGIASGLDMVHKQFLAVLAKYGVEPIEALGRPFDPNFHEALMQQPSADAPEGTVVAELGKGYKIHDRVLRPSKVAVSVKP